MKEIEKIARGMFNYTIEQGQRSAIEEGLDKLGIMPHKSEWSGMSEEDKEWWRNEARAYIKIFKDIGFTLVEPAGRLETKSVTPRGKGVKNESS